MTQHVRSPAASTLKNFMADMSFSFQYLPDEDRIGLFFNKHHGEAPAPILLTRRLVMLLAGYLRRFIEKNTSLPETVCSQDIHEVLQFIHQSELKASPPKWESGRSQKKRMHVLRSAKLATQVDIQQRGEKLRLLFYRHRSHLVSLTLGWKEVHSFLYSMAEMAKKADWGLEEVFEWSGQTGHIKPGQEQYM
jgi:hypothetical protein